MNSMIKALTDYLGYLLTYDLVPILIELFIIGFVVYSVMRFLRGTGGEKLFKGIAVVLVSIGAISLAADLLKLELERIELLFKGFMVAALVISTVAFQPEIRRGLIRLGGTSFGRTDLPETEQAIEQVVDAVSVMSRNQIGAIIAWEREVGLADWIATGTQINAKVTADLINTIFWPGSPLHDMAVVIRRDKITAAGVQFPLAEHGEFDRQLGSRHRAAIGLSKVTDAPIIVVSEETGNISLGLDGKLQRYLTLEQLRQQLVDLMISQAKDKKLKKKASAKRKATSGGKKK